MMKEILTCDGCSAVMTNRKFLELSVREHSPVVRGHRPPRFVRSTYRDLCKECWGLLVSALPTLPRATKKERVKKLGKVQRARATLKA